VLDQRGRTLFAALWTFSQEHQLLWRSRRRRRGRPRLDDVYVRGGDEQGRGSGL